MRTQSNKVQDHLDRRRRLKRLWWFISFTFPLVCAAFAPLANLFSVLSFVEPWVVIRFRTLGPRNPPWLLTLNGIALATAIVANVLLLLGFARRLKSVIAQLLTVVLWYVSASLQIVAFSLTTTDGRNTVHSQAYYYAFLSCIMHMGMATLLLLSLLPSFHFPVFKATFPAYSSQILALTAPQRTIMLQTLFFTLYLALGAAIFASLNGWSYLDAIYWTDYSLLTIGFGSDFTVVSPAAKAILIFYAAVGIFMLGLVVGSIRRLFVERFQERVLWGKEIVQKEREKWWQSAAMRKKGNASRLWRAIRYCCKRNGSRDPQEEGCEPPMKWSREEWVIMRQLKDRVHTRRRYLSLLTTSVLFLAVWFGGAFIFCFTEQSQGGFTYPLSLYFTYVSLLTIGYGDVVPKSTAGKPVFVLWSLAAVPAVTLLISDIQATLATWATEGPVETIFGRWLIGNVEDENQNHIYGPEDEEKERGADDKGNDPEVKKDESSEQLHAYKKTARKAHVLLHEIKRVLDDEENKQYSWEEWQGWIELLELDEDKGCEQGHVSNWTWLGDDGPLLCTRESEKIWLLNRFRRKLDRELDGLQR